MAEPDDKLAQLWAQAFRAQVDGLVTQVEAQVRQLAAHTAAIDAREREGLLRELTAVRAQLAERERTGDEVLLLREQVAQAQKSAAAREESLSRFQVETERLQVTVRQRDEELARVKAELDRAQAALRNEQEAHRRTIATGQTRDAEHARAVGALESRLRDLGAMVQTIDEQFTAERAFVAAVLPVAGSGLFDATQQAAGVPLEETPVCFGALKDRKLEAVLLQTVRERGRSATRMGLIHEERVALEAMAAAAGCELVDVATGQRFAAATMEKAGTRAEPAEEGNVLSCVMPGLRRAGTTGSLAHAKVIVATG